MVQQLLLHYKTLYITIVLALGLDITRAFGEFEDTKGVTRICISKKNRQHNGLKKKYKRKNNDLQNIHIRISLLRLKQLTNGN
jgi:hypothetical protein